MDGEDWPQIVRWFKMQEAAGDAGRLGIGGEALEGLRAVSRRAFNGGADERAVMTMERADALRDQMRFWECCPDELPARCRERMPPWGVFQSAALSLEADLNLWPEVPDRGRTRGRRT